MLLNRGIRGKWTFASVLLLAGLLVSVSGCGEPPATTSPGAPSVTSPATTAGSPTTSPTAPSGADPRVSNVDTPEEASRIAGYAIGLPAFVPAGFEPASRFMIGTIGFGDSAFKQVTRVWRWSDNTSAQLMLVQSPRRFEIASGEPTEVNGKPGQRALLNEETSGESPELTLAWEQDGAFFSLTGTISGPLNEEVLRKVAASIELQ